MGRPVGAHQTGPVERKAHRQPLDRDIVHHLVIGALQEGRIDRRERLEAFGRQPPAEGHRVLLGDPDVEAAVGELLLEQIEPGARRHRRGDRDDLVVLARLLDQALAEHLGVLGSAALRLRLHPGHHVELDHPVVLVGRGLGRRIALALLRHDVHQNRSDLGVAHVAQHGQQMIEIVPIDRPDVIKAQLLEQRAAGDVRARVLDRPRNRPVENLGQMPGQLFADVAQLQIRAPGAEPRQISRHGADRRRNRHVVVVQDHDQPLVARAGIVHRLISHARRHGAIADHRDDVVLLAGQIPRHRHAKAGRDRGRGMRRPERVVFALRPLGEAGQSAALP